MRSPRPFVALAVAALAVPLAAAADGDTPPADPLQALADMTKAGTLFDKQHYKTVRGHCTRMFEDRHKADIRTAYGSDLDALAAWLDKNKEIKEEFYTAIDDKVDNVPAALKVFHDIWKDAPETAAKYPNLAIAHAVVWDDPRGVYDHTRHQVRTHSTLPDGTKTLSAVDSFRDHVGRAKEVKGRETVDRFQAFPWEFLVYVVNHRTTPAERAWAAKNYVPKRPMIGRIYTDIAYDYEMLKTDDAVCKLGGKPYTLESILKHGGVCAMQADFAARVGKSVGVPAAYVSGESQFGGRHAWVMWVEVRSVSAAAITFSLESTGRYQGDNFYTGTLADPQTGEKILDRDMERRLNAVATNRVGKRQAELGMKYYPEICEKRAFDQKKKIQFLDRCLVLSPYNEAAWLALARQVSEGELDAEVKPMVLAHVESMLRSFAKYPDFTWRVGQDLMKIQTGKAAQVQFFGRLVALYETAGRPDLACEARLKWAEYQADDEKWAVAAQGLATTVQKFPAEGRYVPKLVEKLADVCGRYKGGADFLATQYVALVKKIPPARDDEPSAFYAAMHEKAVAFLKETKKDKLAKELERVAPVKMR